MAKLDGDWIYLSEDELSNVKGISKGRQKVCGIFSGLLLIFIAIL